MFADLTIHAKIFVTEEEIEEQLREDHPLLKDSCDQDETGETKALYLCSVNDEHQAFRHIAERKIKELLPLEYPLKVYDTTLDLTSYHS